MKDEHIIPAALNVNAAAKHLGISRASLYRLMKSGELPVAKVGGRTLLRRVDLDNLLARAVDTGVQYPLEAAKPVRRRVTYAKSDLSIAETAKLFRRSYSWARDCTIDGRLKTVHPYGVKPILVTKASINAMIDEIRGAPAVERGNVFD